MADLKTLKIKRGQLKSQLTRFQSYLEKADEIDIGQLKLRLIKAETVLDEFNALQLEIEILDESEIEAHESQRISFENLYFESMAKAKKLVDESNNKSNDSVNTPPENSLNASKRSISSSSIKSEISENSVNSVISNRKQPLNINTNVKLPIINLPIFDGAYDKWLSFHDMFSSLIHENLNISEIQKFHYLRSSLEGEAAAVIDSLEISTANYEIALKLLRERFENKELMIHNHVTNLLNLPSISRESYDSLRKLSDSVSKHLRALRVLKQPVEHWDTLLIHLILLKLDPVTRRDWEKAKRKDDLPSMNELLAFLNDKCNLLETLQLSKSEIRESTHKTKLIKSHFVAENNICACCKQNHLIQNCQTLKAMSVEDRLKRVKGLGLCINCLRRNHIVKNCKSVSSCKICAKRHNTLLHISYQPSTVKPESSEHNSKVVENTMQISETKAMVANHSVYQHSSDILLSTALVQIFDKDGNIHQCRALLDSGSQSSFITKDLCDRLGLPINKTQLSIIGVNQIISNVNWSTNIKVKSRLNSFSKTFATLIIPKITDSLPSFPINRNSFNIPQNIKLADPEFHVCGKVEMLIGANLFWELLCVGQIKMGNHGPILQKTQLGWIVSGPISNNTTIGVNHNKIHCNFSIDFNLKQFWELEECERQNSNLDDECEKIFRNTTERNSQGRFIVSLPLSDKVFNLGDSKEMAKKRFLSLERKLERDPALKQKYTDFMNEYENLGHMTKLNNVDIDNSTQSYYLPHHAVINNNSETTKLRVVFDGSARPETGLSINDVQLVGPTIQDDLFSICIRFRKHNIVLIADIEKMYRQVLVKPAHRALQRIYWRNNSTEPLQTFELNTVTYGTASAAFLAIRALHQLAFEYATEFPKESEIIRKDFYVDDLITGGETVSEVFEIYSNITKLLKLGCFKLRKWASNSVQVMEDIKRDETEIQNNNSLVFGSDSSNKILGLIWQANSYRLKYATKAHDTQSAITKRRILSSISQIFDPLGLLGPAIIIAKIILQQLWEAKLSWDESIPLSIHTKWAKLNEQLHLLNNLEINRKVLCENPNLIELHGFSDASETAYGACIYIRSRDSSGKYHVSLLCAKSRVAPIKKITIPRLELCGALLLAKLFERTKAVIDIQLDAYFLWSDSTIVLAWLKANPNQLKRFVANRISQIQEITNIAHWYHVSSHDNPADQLSRGIYPSELLNSRLWWSGPLWLKQEPNEWPKGTDQDTNIANLPEQKGCSIVHSNASIQRENFISKFSSFSKLKRVVAYILRFKNNCLKPKAIRILGPLNTKELIEANKALIRIAQMDDFYEEIQKLKEGKSISKRSKLISLDPFLDEDGMIRVGGRLKQSEYSFQKRHPAVLPAKHIITKLIAKFEHSRLLHAGSQAVLSSLREKYWPVGGRNLIRKIARECITCFKANPSISEHKMGDLPPVRLTPSRPFQNCGIDYAGPIHIRDRKTRGYKISKAYICLFICLTTKAIHLELVNDLSTESFIAALRRFTARRGKCKNIYSDNGKNFVGAQAELSKFLVENTNQILNESTQQHLNWHFIPPNAPHFGGIWEAGVKSVKYHLHRVIKNALLTYEQFYTYLTQVEACLNSRPLHPLSNDPNDLNPLTPAHFLIGETLTSLPDDTFVTTPTNRLSQFQHVQKLMQHFWARWTREYIGELQTRAKWKQNCANLIHPGTLVLVKEENLPPLKWQLGRIIETHPGKDGIVRTATLKTTSGIYKRPVVKLCALPVSS